MHSRDFCDKSEAITRVELFSEYLLFVVIIHNEAVKDKAILMKQFEQKKQ